jgi:hypothetical protein
VPPLTRRSPWRAGERCCLAFAFYANSWNGKQLRSGVGSRWATSLVALVVWACGVHPPYALAQLPDGIIFDQPTIADSAIQPGELLGGMPMLGSQQNGRVEVPEPLLFDLVGPLGARQGYLEFNTLAVVPWASSNTDTGTDPFGPGPATLDRGGIEWAPEVEYAIVDNFAIEFELPFEDAKLEEYKLGLQWTIGTAFDNHYIHGFQTLIEPTPKWRNWNFNLLYIGGIRFNEQWSSLFMLGGRMNLQGTDRSQTFERITNYSLFRDLSERAKFGVETNFASGVDGSDQFLVVPQLHYDITQCVEIQTGLGFGAFTEGSEQSYIIRVIASQY